MQVQHGTKKVRNHMWKKKKRMSIWLINQLLQDLMQQGVIHLPSLFYLSSFYRRWLKRALRPLERKVEDDNISMGNSNAYFSYHLRKGHPTNSFNTLEEDILDLITQGKYEINKNASNLDHVVNIISVDKEICTTLRRELPRSNPHPHQNPVINEHVILPPDPRAYSMIE